MSPFWGGLLRSRRRSSVLVVDQDAGVRARVRALLAEDFGPIWEASDGSHALDQAYRHQPDLVILDRALPQMDPEAVRKGFRVLAPRAKIVVLAQADIDRLPHLLETMYGRGGR